jgi:probable F420-dependent oxidoreductase
MIDAVVAPYWPDRPPEEALAVADATVAAGVPELWLGEMATYDVFALATAVGSRHPGLRLTLGPLAVHVRSAFQIATGVASVASLTRAHVDVALGTSSPAVVAWHGRDREQPARRLRAAVAEVRSLLSGDRGVTGARLRLRPVPASITVAAFGPLAIDVAAASAERLVLNLVTVDEVARVRSLLDHRVRGTGRRPPRLAAWLTLALDPSADDHAQIARALVQYLAAPGYAEVLERAGAADAVAAARAGAASPKELAGLVPAEVAAAVGLLGGRDEIERRIRTYRSAGLDEVCVVPVSSTVPRLAELVPP